MRNSILLFVVLCAFSGCSSINTQVAKLRLALAEGSFGNLGPNVTVTINGEVTTFPLPTCQGNVSSAPGGTCSLGYLIVPAGGFKFAVQTFAGGPNVVPSQFQTLNLSPSTQNTFVLADQGIGYLFLDDSVPAAGSVKLRIANADVSLNAAAAAWVNSDGSTTGNPTISSVKLGSASSYVTLPPGQYVVTCEPDSLIVGPTTIAANQNVTVYLWSAVFDDIDNAFMLPDN